MEFTNLIIVLVGIMLVVWMLKLIKKGIILLLAISIIAVVASWFLADTKWDDEFGAESIASSFGQGSWELLSSTVAFIKESNLDLNFEENKLRFSNKNGFDGEIAKLENIVYLKTASPTDDDSSVEHVLKLARIFSNSDELMVEMNRVVQEDIIGKIPLGDGSYVHQAEGILTIYLQKSLE